jgi:hypothetical protein
MSRFITHLYYKGDTYQPTLVLSDNTEQAALGKTISLSFDLSTRFCTGWHDITTGESHPCPEQATTDKKYGICPACQKRTGFNPAFYHSQTVSPQQEARNADPHHLYLSYMGEGYIKVGISWHKRDIQRLLDQGARAGLILETFPTALIARQYEAKIAALAAIHETTATRTKLALLSVPFSESTAREHLLATKQTIEQTLSISLSGGEVLFFDQFYAGSAISPAEITAPPTPTISGNVMALIGDILLTNYDGRRLGLPLKQYIGYPVDITDEIIPLDLDPQQLQLF